MGEGIKQESKRTRDIPWKTPPTPTALGNTVPKCQQSTLHTPTHKPAETQIASKRSRDKKKAAAEGRTGREREGGREGEEVAAMMVRQSKAALRVEDRSLRLR